MIILPINSVINPLIYDDSATKLIATPIKRFVNTVSNSTLSVNQHSKAIELERVGKATAVVAEMQSQGKKMNKIADIPLENTNIEPEGEVATDLIEETPL
jgi:hypothetical protein